MKKIGEIKDELQARRTKCCLFLLKNMKKMKETG